MTSMIVKRPPRRPAPPLPSGEVLLDPPPEVPSPSGKGWTRLLMILPMAAGAAAMGLMMGVSGGAGRWSTSSVACTASPSSA